MNSAPRFETTEIHDADLDSISGGVAVSTGAALHLEVGPLAVCADVDALVSTEGVAANAYLGLH
ncbi:hypothetical protein [Streptomyces sp. SID13726]|uniref:hypothetical protein n=1 Tax=Streptomyces sp. SID13726 TaxID=2706058 RepID=UPI0013BB5A78|nr:hypothetical protein [Streptomyces sp. SID13726]NEA98671.1 hypothetical protein [Streptomyces sp. SID13726]